LIKAANRGHDSNPINLWFDDDGPPPSSNVVKVKADVDVDMQGEEHLIMCSPTVLGYSLNDKLWRKYPVW